LESRLPLSLRDVEQMFGLGTNEVNTVLFLRSDYAWVINGQAIDVDGGTTLN
jgi:hypothetical protein